MIRLYKQEQKKLLIVSSVVMLYLIYLKYFSQNPIPFSYQCLFFLVAYLLIASDIIFSAFKTLFKQRRMSEQFLMTIATFGAFALQDLPEALAVMIFYKIGELFEKYASGKAHNEISSLVKLKPNTARIIDENGEEQIVKTRLVKIGQTIKVLAGEIVAIDGDLIEDSAAVDTSALTGESEPKLYTKGQSIPSGCINQGNVITLVVNTLSKNSSITRLLNLIEDAAVNKSRPEALIRRFAVFYTPIVVSFACILSLVPFVLPGALFSDWIQRALVFLVVSCPCALVLSVPLSFFGGMGAISRIGVIVKGSIHIETLAKLKGIAFDKTGTLTFGKFKVVNVMTYDFDKSTLLSIAMSLEANSTHPIAKSIVDYAKSLNFSPIPVFDIKEKSGLGIQASSQFGSVRIGKKSYISDIDDSLSSQSDAGDKTQIFISVNDKCVGLIELFDDIKPNAIKMIEGLEKQNLKTILISGDREAVVKSIAGKLNISNVCYEQSPLDKLENFKKFKSENQVVAFIGDGLNDAPVLSCADVGIAMGDIGSSSAIEAADVVIMKDDLSTVVKTILMARKTYNLAISNFYFVMGIKVLILLLGAFGIANIWLAIFGDVGVLVLAVCNAMRSLRFKM